MPSSKSIASFSLLSFDCYATLVDWETGIFNALQPLLTRLPDSHPMKTDRAQILQRYTFHEGALQKQHPQMPYDTLLGIIYHHLAVELGLDTAATVPGADESRAFGASIGHWPAFPDTVAALHRLSQHFKLVILSNVDRASFRQTLAGPLQGSIQFDAIYTAEEIGSYKPDLANFHYLIQRCETDLGVAKGEILHTAQALFHDLVPANKVGLASCWIERGEKGGGVGAPAVMGGDLESLAGELDLSFRFGTLAEMADAVEAAVAAEK